MKWSLEHVDIISRRPGNENAEALMAGDVVEVKTAFGGYVQAIDPITYQSIDKRQRFEVESDGTTLRILHG